MTTRRWLNVLHLNFPNSFDPFVLALPKPLVQILNPGDEPTKSPQTVVCPLAMQLYLLRVLKLGLSTSYPRLQSPLGLPPPPPCVKAQLSEWTNVMVAGFGVFFRSLG